MATITEKLADLQAQTAQWIEWLDRGLISFDGYQEKLKAIETQTRAVTGSLEGMGAASAKVNIAPASSQQEQISNNLLRYFDAIDNAPQITQANAQKMLEQARYAIESGNQKEFEEVMSVVQAWYDAANDTVVRLAPKVKLFESDLKVLTGQLTQVNTEIKNKEADGSAYKEGAAYNALLEKQKKIKEEIALLNQANFASNNNYEREKEIAAINKTALEQLRQIPSQTRTSAASTTPAKTYEIKFTTAAGQSKTLTTTQNPEEFLAALEAAQRVT